MIYYKRYHDFIDLSHKSVNMVDVYWELNKQYLLSSSRCNEISSRRNLSIDKVLLNYFKNNVNITPSQVSNIIYTEIINELYMRLEWEESKLYDAIKSFRLVNFDITIEDIDKWKCKYAELEEQNRVKWLTYLFKVLNDVFKNNIINFVSDDITDEIKNLVLNEQIIPSSNFDLYESERFNYLFEVDMSKIVLDDGLWKIIEGEKIITTAKINSGYTRNTDKIVSFKTFYTSTIKDDIMGNSDKSDKSDTNCCTINNNKDKYSRRKQLQEEMFGKFNAGTYRKDESIINIIRKQYGNIDRKTMREINRDRYSSSNSNNDFVSKQYESTSRKTINKNNTESQPVNNNFVIKQSEGIDRKTMRQNNRDKYLSNNTDVQPENTDRKITRENIRDQYLSCKPDIQSVNSKFIDKKTIRENNMDRYLEKKSEYNKLDIVKAESVEIDDDDMKYYEIVEESDVMKYLDYFHFIFFRKCGKFYVHRHHFENITRMYNKCKKYSLKVGDFVSKIYKTTLSNDRKFKTSHIGSLFKNNKLNLGYYLPSMFDPVMN